MKKILITDASSGIGKELAINLTDKTDELFLLNSARTLVTLAPVGC